LTIATTLEYSRNVTKSAQSGEIGFIDRQITRAFQYLVDSEFRTLGIDPLPSPHAELSPRLRYAPMQRLLLSEDHFLERAMLSAKGAQLLHQAHLACYRMFLKELRAEVRRSRRRTSFAMECSGRWDLQPFLGRLVRSESSLIYLSWLGWKGRFGFRIDVGLMAGLLDYLLLGEISQPEAMTQS
jgi:hypothetical protein